MKTDNLKKLIYLANIGLPGDWAHSLQIMKMCEAFASLGVEVELVVPRRSAKALVDEDPFVFYNVARTFKITRLFCIDLVPGGTSLLNFLLRTFSFLCSARIHLFFKRFDVLYTREQFAGLFFSKVVYELHYLPKKISWFHKLNWCKAKSLIVLTRFIKEQLVQWKIKADKILVAPDAVDLAEFSLLISKEEARKFLALPTNKKIILYTGSFFTHSWKGVDILLESALSLSDEYSFVFVGGNEKEIEQVKKEFGGSNLIFVGQKLHKQIPCYLKAADVLILPNKKGSDHSEKFTSPLKLFEYMASQRPIIASDLPSIREVLNEKNCLFFKPDDAKDLAEKIRWLLGRQELADQIAGQAYLDVQNFTWQKRAETINKFMADN